MSKVSEQERIQWWRRRLASRAAVKPSVGRKHAFDGWPRMATLGLRGAWTAQRNAAGNTFCAIAILQRAESRWFAFPWQTPLVACDEPCFSRPGSRARASTRVRAAWPYGAKLHRRDCHGGIHA